MTATLTAAEIAEARELIAKATKGPWETFDPEDYHGRIQVFGQTTRDGGKTSTPIISDGCFAPDAAFIAAARTGWPAALDALEEAGRALDRANERCPATVDWRGMRIELETECRRLSDRTLKAESSLAASDAARVRAEGERDEARRMYCVTNVDNQHPTGREVCLREWPSAADSLFPDGEVK